MDGRTRRFRAQVRPESEKFRTVIRTRSGRMKFVHKQNTDSRKMLKVLEKMGWVSFGDACLSYNENLHVFHVCIGLLLTAAENGEIEYRTAADLGFPNAPNADFAVFVNKEEALRILRRELGRGKSLAALSIKYERDWFFQPNKEGAENVQKNSISRPLQNAEASAALAEEKRG